MPSISVTLLKKQLNYDRNCLLSRGSLGFIFRGSFCGTPVAVKRIQLVEIHSNTSGNNWKERDSLLKQLVHPNVVQLFSVEDEPGFRLYGFELCGASIDQMFLLDDDPRKYSGLFPSHRQALLQITQGLHYIHSKGMFLCCFQPKNVLISTTGTAHLKISSWCAMKSGTNCYNKLVAQGLTGILDWIAPEFVKLILKDVNNIKISGSEEGDIFVAGCVFFFLVSRGYHPFTKHINPAGINIVDEPISGNLSKLDQAHFAWNLIDGMICHKPEKRIKLQFVLDFLSNPRMKFARTVKESGTKVSKTPTTSGLKRKRQLDPSTISSAVPVVLTVSPIMSFHPSEPLLASYTCRPLPNEERECVVLWKGSNHSGPFLDWMQAQSLYFGELICIHKIYSLEWSTDGTKLAAGFDYGSFIIWGRDGQILFHYTQGYLARSSNENLAVFAIHWNPFKPSLVLFQALRSFSLMNMKSMSLLRRPFQRSKGLPFFGHRKIADVQWISADKLAICYSDRSAIEIWQIGQVDPIKVLNEVNAEGMDRGVKSVCWNGILKVLVSCQDRQIKVWLKKNPVPIVIEFLHDCRRIYCFVPQMGSNKQEHLIACGLGDGTIEVLRVFQDQERIEIEELANLFELTQNADDVAFSPDGRFFAVVDCLGLVVIWSTKNWERVYELKEITITDNHESVGVRGKTMGLMHVSRHRLRWNSTGSKLLINKNPCDPHSTIPDGISMIENLPDVDTEN